MIKYSILRIYEIPAESAIQATRYLHDAIENGTEKDYHVKDIVQVSRNNPSNNKSSKFTPTGWKKLLLRQLRGR